MDHYLSDAVAPRRFSLSLMAAFALAALALAVTGIYAVVMYSVSQRAREIGIRVALGATRSNIVRLVMGHGIRFILIGLVLGIAMAAGVTRLLSTHALRTGGHGCRDIWPGRRGRRRRFGSRLRGAGCARRETGGQRSQGGIEPSNCSNLVKPSAEPDSTFGKSLSQISLLG